MGAALERALQRSQALCAVAFVDLEVLLNGDVFHAHAAAHGGACIDQGHRRLAACHQQAAAIVLGGGLRLQQRFKPDFSRGIARDDEGAQ